MANKSNSDVEVDQYSREKLFQQVEPIVNGIDSLPLNKTISSNLKISSYAEFMSGYFAACTSIILLFPLNKIIFRQQIDGTSFKEALIQLKSEGISKSYRGMLPPLLQKSASYSIMFGSQNEYYLILKKWSENNWTITKNTNLMLNGLAGGLAGLTEATLTPFERVQAVLQVEKFYRSYTNTWHVFQQISANYGYRELFRGYSAICMRNSLSNVVFFTSRKPLKSLFPTTDNTLKNGFYDFASGGLLGASISTFFYPLNVIKSHMQIRIGGKYIGILEAFNMIHESRDRRFLNFFKGVHSNFLRAVFAWGITNSMYELVLHTIKSKVTKM
jgi:hypothetical protein